MAKKIGILGGLSPESTSEYYLHLTRSYTQRFNNFAYPEIIIYSVQFQSYVDWPNQERWDLVAQGLTQAACKLEAAGADFIIIATNTMHLVFDQVQAGVNIPMLSLVEAVGNAILAKGLHKVGLLGTRFTMEKTFYQNKLASMGIEVLIPGSEERALVNHVIYNELVAAKFLPESRNNFLKIIDNLAARGAQGIILGCTEIPLLVHAEDTPLPLFDTTVIHADAALAYALEEYTHA